MKHSKTLRILALIMCISMVFTLAACGKKPDNPKPEDTQSSELTQEEYDKMTAEQLIDRFVKDRKNVTTDELAGLVNTFRFAKIGEDLVLEDNITSEAIRTLRSDDDATVPSGYTVFGKLINSDSPQVRGIVMSYTGSIFGTDSEDVATMKNVIKTETEPYVLRCAVDALSNEGGRDKDVGNFLINMAKHENKYVRLKATYALGNSWSKGVDGAVDMIITLMDDKDDEVRAAAYRYSSKLGDEAVIDPIKKMLDNPELADFHDDGIISLNYMWYNYPFHESTSERAYNIVMDYFKNAPRTDKTPPWTAISDLRSKADSSFDEWKAKATYYKPEDIVAVMKDIIADGNVNWLGRSAAINVIKTHGTKEDLESLKSLIDGLTDSDAHLLQSSYESAVKD